MPTLLIATTIVFMTAMTMTFLLGGTLLVLAADVYRNKANVLQIPRAFGVSGAAVILLWGAFFFLNNCR